MNEEAEEIRALLDARRNRRGRARPSVAEQERIVAYVRGRQKSGADKQDIAAELGVRVRSLARWSERMSTRKQTLAPKMRRVEIVAPKSTMRVVGAHGVVVEGLDVDTLAELLRRLG